MIKCFISFCSEEVREIDLRAFVSELKRFTHDDVEYLFYFDREYGDSLTRFSNDDLSRAEACLILLGPEYKRRVEDTVERSGVFQEYDLIVQRLEKSSENYKKLRVIPVMWKGKQPDEILPHYFSTYASYVCELTSFRMVGADTQSPFLPERIKRKLNSRIERISEQLRKEALKHNHEFERIEVETFSALLGPRGPSGLVSKHNNFSVEDVLAVKYEHGDYDSEFFRDRYFTRTAFFRRLIDRNIGLLSGRKGSGKTTLVQVRENEARGDEYYSPIDVRVEGWDFHYIVQNSAFHQAESDFQYIALDSRFFDFVWAAFVALCMVDSLFRFCKRDTACLKGAFVRADHMTEFLYTLGDLDPQNPVFHASIFNLSVKLAREYIGAVVSSARATNEDEFRIDIIKAVSVSRLLESLFGPRLIGIRDLVFQTGNRRFLFCFDRFDSLLQSYRRDNIEKGASGIEVARSRIRREIEWLASLVRFVESSQRPDRLASEREIFEFFSQVKFLVVLPYDRATEIRKNDRDSIAGEPLEQIAWQPLELLTMLRKRVQVLFDVADTDLAKQRNDGPLDRYERCLKIAGIELPKAIPVHVSGREFQFDLFLEVLRHTFFRPRDVLIYFAAILTRVRAAKLRDRNLQVEHCREIISDHTITVTDLEFVGELKDTWTNIEHVLQRFKSRGQALTARQLEEIIGPVEFVFYDEAQKMTSLNEKIEYLFAIGFLGLKNARDSGGAGSRSNYTFSFFNPKRVFDFSSSEVVLSRQYAIHPVFIERLSLNVNVDEPVMSFDWKLINDMDRLE